MAHWRTYLESDARGGRYLPWKEVARTTGLSRTTAWRLQRRDDFPAPYAISPGRVGYREDEVEAWRASRDRSAPRPRVRQPGPRSPTSATVADETRAAAAIPEPTAAPEPAARPSEPPAESISRTSQRRRPADRQDEHAKAIAQQMRFDF